MNTLPAIVDTSEVPAPTTTPPSWVQMLTPVADLARQIAGTEFVPESMRNKPAAVAAAILFGAELGLPPMQSLAKIDIVKGRPAPRAELARALALAAGHDVWVDESTNTRVKVSGRRRGSDVVQSVTWTLDDAKRAGIVSQMYTKYPRQMLLARASAELVRQMAPDVLGGIAVFAEEADDPTTASTASTTASATTAQEPAAASTTRRRRATAQPVEQPADASAPTDEPTDEPTPSDGITADQIKRLMAGFNEIGIKAKADRLAFIAAATRPVDSSRDLTRTEASTVIDATNAVNQGRLSITYSETGEITLTPTDEPSQHEQADAAEDLPPLPNEDNEEWP